MAWFIAPLFFWVALIYSSVGFGGGSMYLAVLSYTTLSQDTLRIIALVCNSLVTSSGSINFLRESQNVKNRILPLLLFSTPSCILTSSVKISDRAFFLALSLALMMAGAFMFVKVSKTTNSKIKNPWYFYPLCSAIGALAGLTGIGGGVYLAPFLTMNSWGSAKEISAACALFILINSIASLFTRMIVFEADITSGHYILFFLVLAGGSIGSYFSSTRFKDQRIRRLTGIILMISGLRILLK